MLAFFRKVVIRKEPSLEDRIIKVASSACFKDNRDAIVHDIIYDRRGARSLLGWDQELEDRVGGLTPGVREEDAVALETEIMSFFSPAPTSQK